MGNGGFVQPNKFENRPYGLTTFFQNNNYKQTHHPSHPSSKYQLLTSAANRLIGEVIQSQRRPLLEPSPGGKRLLGLSNLRHYAKWLPKHGKQ